AGGRWQHGVAEPGGTMGVVGVHRLLHQGPVLSARDRGLEAEQLGEGEVVAVHRGHLDVAAGGDDARDLGGRMRGEVGQGDRVVDAGVAVDQEGERHTASVRPRCAGGAWRGRLGCGRIERRRAHSCSTTVLCANGCVRPRSLDPHATSGRTVASMTETTKHEDLTVGRDADLVGVSVRTLHRWDAIGLVRPSGRSWSGYRLYDTDDVARIHRVLVYRELGLALAQIGEILDDPSVDPR